VRKAITIMAILFLAACESDFDKCMKVELPRAEEALRLSYKESLSELEAHVERAVEFKDKWSQFMLIADADLAWRNENPAPDDRESPEYDAWNEAWEEFKASGVAQLNTMGFQGSTDDEALMNMGEWFRSYDSLRRARAAEFDCWGDVTCDNPASAEAKHLFGENYFATPEYQDFIKTEPTLLLNYFEDRLAALTRAQAQVPETAKLVCNRAGIYE